VFKRRRQLDEAGLVDILTASPDRVTPGCAHFGICGGCSLQHLSASAQLDAKQRQLLDNLQRIGRVVPERVLPPMRGPEWGYRRRARLGIKYVHKKGRVLAGFREREKPYIADIQRCEILLRPLADLPRDLAALVETLAKNYPRWRSRPATNRPLWYFACSRRPVMKISPKSLLSA
jgi:23S rRNA (uracil1939-C5)-methyltransferase